MTRTIVSFEAFVIYSVLGSDERIETVVPAAIGRTRDDLRVALTLGNGAHFTEIVLHVVEPIKGHTRESLDVLRERARPAGQLALF